MTKRKLGALDIVIIASILIAIVGVAVFYQTKGDTQGAAKKTTIEFDILAINLSEQEAQSIKNQEGTNIIFGKTNSDTGLMKKVVIEPYEWLGKDTVNGEFVWSIHPTNFQVIVTVEKDVTQTDDLFKGDKEEIRIGEGIPFRGKGFGLASAYIVDLKEVSK